MKFLLFVILLSFVFLISRQNVEAESNYVLPYPSFMPGSSFYKVHLLWEKVSEYWYFGSFAKIEYNLKQSDKYLVEAKTLFEYKQYLLAYSALNKSDIYFGNIKQYLKKAQKENKDINQKQNLLKEASLKHIEKLKLIKTIIPEKFIWQPEKSSPTELDLYKAIEESIKIRRNF